MMLHQLELPLFDVLSTVSPQAEYDRDAGLLLDPTDHGDIVPAVSDVREPKLVTHDKALTAKWGVEQGQVWRIPSLGSPDHYHYLACGDSTSPLTYSTIPHSRYNLIFTSPPYADQRKFTYTSIPLARYAQWWEQAQATFQGILTDDGSLLVNIKEHITGGQRSTYVLKLVLAMTEQYGWYWIDTLCWIRNTIPGLMGPRFRNYWEPIYHWSRCPKPKFRPTNVLVPYSDERKARVYNGPESNISMDQRYQGGYGDRSAVGLKSKNYWGAQPSNTMVINKGYARNPGHSAVFPLRLPLFHIRAYTDPGDYILDPFVGSGTTMLAAESTGRLSCGVDIEPDHIATVLTRFSREGMVGERTV